MCVCPCLSLSLLRTERSHWLVSTWQAFFHLFDKQMLTSQEEKRLVASLNYSADELGLLRLLYQAHVGKVRRGGIE